MKSSYKRFWRKFPWNGLALLVVLSLACRSTDPESTPAFPPELPPLMQALRKASRDFKSALVIHDQDRMNEHAKDHTAAAAMIGQYHDFPIFYAYAQPLAEKSRSVRKAVESAADPDRISVLFSDFVAGCIDCHHRCRLD